MLDEGADVNGVDENGKTLLIWSIAYPDSSNGTDLSAPRMLIEHSANVNYRMPDCPSCARPTLGVATVAGFTPLQYAAWSGDTPLAALLVESGAELDVPDDAGKTPLFSAIDLGQYDVAKFLIAHGASVPVCENIANRLQDQDVKNWLNANGFPN